MNHYLYSLLKQSKSIGFLVLLMLFSAHPIWSQNVQVSGVVRDANNITLPGVSVLIKGTTTGVFADINGNYSISIPKNLTNPTLRFVFMGYLEQEQLVENRTEINVTLLDDISKLDEVIVVGYGTQKKGSITGSVASISSKDLIKAPVADITNSIAGRLPGIRAINRSGEPGSSGADLDVRGFGKALIIIDGIPGDFNQIDANEIESISTLKDASASVYGVKAANGVILITTKRGKSGITQIKFNMNAGWQVPTKYPKFLTAGEFAELMDEDAINRGNTPNYGAEEVAKWKGEVDDKHKSTDWYKEVVRDYAPQQQYNININGGKDSLKYFASVGHLNQGSMWVTGDTRFHRYNFRTNVDAKIKGGLSTSISIAGRQENIERPFTGAGTIMSSLIRNYPTYTPYANGNTNYYGVTNQPHQNPLVLINKNVSGYTKGKNNVFDGSLTLNYDFGFIEGLQAKVMYAYRINTYNYKSFQKKYELYKYDESTNKYEVNYTGNEPSKLFQETFEVNYGVFQSSLEYKKTFKTKHAFESLLLVETRKNDFQSLSASREFIIDALDEMFAGAPKNKDNNGFSEGDSNIGYIGRLNYAYNKKYLLEVSFRYDGSSKFPKNNRWGLFPAISGGWKITEEQFIKNTLFSKIVNDLKLRASWGRLGDDDASKYQYLTGYTYPSGSYVLGDDVTAGLISKGLPNKNITWYTSALFNLGVDFSLWNGLLGGEFDFFNRNRKGLLATRVASLPGTFGATLPYENLEGDQDRGFELVLRHANKLKNGIRYRVAANVSRTRSKFKYKEESTAVNQYQNWKQNKTDRYKNRWLGYQAIGQFQSFDEISSAPIQDGVGNKSLRPGDIRFADYNRDGVIDSNDEHIIGRGEKPEIMFGLDLSAEWKGFDISVFFQGAALFNAYFDSEMQNPFMNGANSLQIFTDRWRREDPYNANSNWISGKYPSTYASGLESNKKVSSFWLQDATYIRLKDLQIGYTIPKKTINKLGLEQLRIYASGYNLLTISKLELLDPEAPSGRGAYYPQQKIFTLGLNITL